MVIGVGGKWVTPGMVAAVTDLGLYDVSAVDPSNDAGAAKSRFNAALDIATAINPASQHVLVGRARGVTRAVVTGNQIGRATSELQSLMRSSYGVFCLKKTSNR